MFGIGGARNVMHAGAGPALRELRGPANEPLLFDAARGMTIPFARTLPSHGTTDRVIVFQGGLRMSFEHSQEYASQLADRAHAAVYRLQFRSDKVLPSYKDHAKDIDAMLKYARSQHPMAEPRVEGESAGANSAAFWNTHYNRDGVAVDAMPPTVLTNLTTFPLPEVVQGMAGSVERRGIGSSRILAPDGKGRPLTSNPDNPLYFPPGTPPKVDPNATLPAAAVGDAVRLGLGSLHRARGAVPGPLTYFRAGNDQLQHNFAMRGFALLSHPSAVVDVRGGAHALSTETHPQVDIVGHVVRNMERTRAHQ